MTGKADFDALSRRTTETGSTRDDQANLYAAAFALPQWHFIARGDFPDVLPYVASNANVADGKYMFRAFTDTDRLYRFAQENAFDKDVAILSLPTESIVDYLEQFISQGVWGIWFNSDSTSDGFFAPLEQLRPIRQFIGDLR